MIDKPYILECRKCLTSFNGHHPSSKLCDGCKRNSLPRQKRMFFYNKIKVFERDKNRCRACKKKFEKKNNPYKKGNWLVCHHIDANRINNSLSNLITMCNSCHLQLHHRYQTWELKNLYIEDILPIKGKWKRKPHKRKPYKNKPIKEKKLMFKNI